ncbi:MAG: hypothetical protein GQ569_07365 [Methylococcaceae bacterium]|nr:hypothetical protein [Methylococcaceae bacterium]
MYKNILKGCLISLATMGAAYADEPSENTEQWLRAAQNPLLPVFSVPFNYTFHGSANNGDVSIFALEPIMPIKLGSVNIINQLSLRILDTDGGITGIEELPQLYASNSATGLADTYFTSYISPANSGDFQWGIGPTFMFPSDHPKRELGSGKFSLGPAAMLVKQTDSWTLGLRVKQLWSIIGSNGRSDISQMTVEPFASYNLDQGWYLSTNMDMISNWNSTSNNRWTIPIGAGVGKVFNLSDYAINAKVGGYYNVDRPDQAPDWSMNFTLQFMLPDWY